MMTMPDKIDPPRKTPGSAAPENHKHEGKERSRLLLVDDEPQIVRTLQATLSTQGYEIRTAANGLDGLILFRAW
jgi:response regulator RpfG family c-di-GMP phosphodiesterase